MDNRYNTCPALMSDKRIFTNYFDNDVFNQTIRVINNINDNHDYRLFLQTNGTSLINREREYNLKYYTCDVNGKCINWQK